MFKVNNKYAEKLHNKQPCKDRFSSFNRSFEARLFSMPKQRI